MTNSGQSSPDKGSEESMGETASEVYIGVDVGSGSARAGVFDAQGRRLGYGSRTIGLWRPQPDWAEQSTGDIWEAVVTSVRTAMAEAGVPPEAVRGIGFDATCSLALAQADGSPLALAESAPLRDVIVWMDHRALAEAEEITATGAAILNQVGGVMSPEMELPKLLWLKRHRPELWSRLGTAWDLGDWLTWRATGSSTRSACTIVCKWCFDFHAHGAGQEGWPRALLTAVDMVDLLDRDYAIVGNHVVTPGIAVGHGLSHAAAEELGLVPGTPVGAAAIDAHAGAIGILGSVDAAVPFAHRLALIAGTSSCHLIESETRFPVPGVWGPYFGALTGRGWLAEAGQSATGAFLDRLIAGHPARAGLQGNPHAALDALIDTLLQTEDLNTLLGTRLVVPDVLGNRSPLADPNMTGAVAGLTLADDSRDLAALYLAGLLALAYGSRHIIAALSASGHTVEAIVATGSGAKNRQLMQAHADACGIPVYLPHETEGVILGAAMLGAVAGGCFVDLGAAMTAMAADYTTVHPRPETQALHDRRYAATRALQDFLRQMA
jgi:FGGY-family pentulose kinase